MIDGMIKWSLNNRLLVLFAAALLLIWGIYETRRMPLDVFPDLSAPTVTVLTEAHGMAPEEVETLITFPIETAMNGASQVRRVRSMSAIGISVVWVEFEWGADIYQARQIVAEKLQLARSEIPDHVDAPVLAPVSSIMGEVLFVALTSDQHGPEQLKTTADWLIRRRLLAVTGVSQVSTIGGDTKQFQVLIKPQQLQNYNLSVAGVVAVAAGSNTNTSAGIYNEGGQEFIIHGLGRIDAIEDLAQTVVTMAGDQPVLLNQVAEVRTGAALKRGAASLNGQDAVIIGVQKQPGVNTIQLTAELDAVLIDIQANLPEGMHIERHIFRQADFIEVAIDNVVEALRDGTLLVILIVGLFLASIRATAITVLAIPLSLVVAVLVLQAMGITLNTMTLGGMAIAIGALVDDAIIDVENVVRRLKENAALAQPRPVLEVVFAASKEIRVAIVFATLIIVLVFLPLFFLSGVEGRLLQPLGLAYVVSLGASLLTALTVTPVLCLLLIPGSRAMKQERDPLIIRSLKALYQPILRASLPRWFVVSAFSLLLLVLSLPQLIWMGKSFLPEFNEGTLSISAVTLPGTSLEESHKMGRMVEQILLEQPEVVSTARRTGRAELDEHAMGTNASEIDVNLVMGDRSKEAFLADLRAALASVPGMNITIGQPISHRIDHMLSGTRANIAVKLFGPDLEQLHDLAEACRDAMSGVAGVVDLSIDQQSDIPLLQLKFKRNAIAQYGLSIAEVAETVETAFYGQTVSRILQGQAAFDLVVKLDPKVLDSQAQMMAIMVATPLGFQVPLSQLVEVRKARGPNMIQRENVARKMVVMCNVAERDLTSVVRDIQTAIAQQVQLPAGYHVEYGGQFENAQQATQTLLLVGIAVIIGIFILLIMALGSVGDALLVMVNLPLALIGGVAGVWLFDGVISIASIIGFITLFGIATRNGILLISHIHHLLDEMPSGQVREAVFQGAMERLAPILMTALSAALALIPLALKAGEPGGEIEAPMAMVILCGLFSSTLLNLIVVPALYLRFGSKVRDHKPAH